MIPNDFESWSKLLDRVASNQVQGSELDDALLGRKQKIPLLETIRLLCLAVPELFPKPGFYCSSEGDSFLQNMAAALRRGPDETRMWLLLQANKHKLDWLRDAINTGINPKW